MGKIIVGGKVGLIEWTDSEFTEAHPQLKLLEVYRVVNEQKSSRAHTVYKFEYKEKALLDSQLITIRAAAKLQILDAGATWLLDRLISSTPLAKALHSVCGQYHLSRKLLSLAYFKL